MTTYERKITLPSKGLLNENIPDGEITIRAMTISEEKKMFGASKNEGVLKALSACIVSPEVTLDDLHPFDQFFVLVNIRRLTYGDEYTFREKCPDCKSITEETLDLATLDETLTYLDDNYKDILKVKLPVKGDTVELRLLMNSDAEKIKKMAQTQASKMGLRAKEVEYDLRIASMITSINGEPSNLTSARVYIKDMHSKDAAKMWDAIDRVTFGYDSTIVMGCPNCGEVEVTLPIGSEFFRPKFRD